VECKYISLKPSTGYSYGCRCDRCRLWHNARSCRYRQEYPEKSYEYDKKWQKKNREKVLAYRKKYAEKHPQIVKNGQLKNRFGITLVEYNQFLHKQNNKCALCFIDQQNCSKAFAVDHNHITGKIRGLLCHPCNVGLGCFKENLLVLENAINYLKKWKEILKEL